ncbi:MAG: carbonic anhydrase [Patescibacteria group bacterium]
MMNKIISHKIDPQHYTADVTIIWCFDDRFSELLDKLARHNGWRWIDLIKIAGGAKGLAMEGQSAEKNFLLNQIEKSISLHHPDTIALMVHTDCGAYGKSFNDAKSEADFYTAELTKAEANLKTFLDSSGDAVSIKKYLADFEGIFEMQ